MERNPGSDMQPDMQQVMELLNETCNQMAEKIRMQEREIRMLREEREERKGPQSTEEKNFRVN
ncbi:MAG: hypothetical protein KC553_03355 [Nitrospina sp.]|nr:hypothetical protein [Nitrospina sp.]